MREILIDEMNLLLLLQTGELVGLIAHSVLYLFVGSMGFTIGYRRARVKGTHAYY